MSCTALRIRIRIRIRNQNHWELISGVSKISTPKVSNNPIPFFIVLMPSTGDVWILLDNKDITFGNGWDNGISTSYSIDHSLAVSGPKSPLANLSIPFEG